MAPSSYVDALAENRRNPALASDPHTWAMVAVCSRGMDVAQVALMGVVSSAVAAMDAQRGLAAVAEHGLGLLRNLSSANANRVRVVVAYGQWIGRMVF
jgi:hypothetical protein